MRKLRVFTSVLIVIFLLLPPIGSFLLSPSEVYAQSENLPLNFDSADATVSVAHAHATSYGNLHIFDAYRSYYMNSETKKCSIRFTARENKTVDGIQFWSAVRAGVSPTYRIGLQLDDGSGKPDGNWLGSSGLGYQDTTLNANSWNAITLGEGVSVTAGEVCHIVAQWVSGTVDSSNFGSCGLSSPFNPFVPLDGENDTYWNFLDTGVVTGGSGWTVRDLTPIFILNFNDGSSYGNPYNGMGGPWMTNGVGEQFTVDSSITVSSVALYIKKVGNPAGYFVLYDVTNDVVVEKISVPAEAVPTSFDWVEVSFSQNYVLMPGVTYQIYGYSTTGTANRWVGKSSAAATGHEALTWRGTSDFHVSGDGENPPLTTGDAARDFPFRFTLFIGPPTKGTLSVDTAPVPSEVFVDGESWGIAPQSRLLPEGNYTVSFGDVPGYVTPSSQEATVTVGQTTSVLGTYEPAADNPPQYSNVGTSTTYAGASCKFYVHWTDESGLSGYIFGTNNTGSWQNETWADPWSGTPTSGWSIVTKTLNSNVGVRVEWRIWANDTSNQWNNTGIQYLITTSAPTELRFVVTSDLHWGQTPPGTGEEEQEMYRHIMEYNPDFIIDLGDWLGDNQLNSFEEAQDYFETVGNSTIFHVIGNHDQMALAGVTHHDYPFITPDEWRDETTGDPYCYAYLHNNILFIFVSTGTDSQSNSFIRYRVRRFVEYVLEKYSTQTFMLFSHHYMNDTMGSIYGYPAYKSGWWATTQEWAEKLMNDYGSRCLGWFGGHVHFPPGQREAVWKYGIYHFPVGYKAEQFFRLMSITASGWTTRCFEWDGNELTGLRMDNSTFSTTFDTSKDNELCIPIWCQDECPHGHYSLHTLSESRKIELVGVRGNETYVNQDMWFEGGLEGQYNTTGVTVYTWKLYVTNNNHWVSREGQTDYLHQVLVLNETQATSSGKRVLRTRTYRWNPYKYYNVSIRIKADQNAEVFIQEGQTSDHLFNISVTTSWQWFYSSSNDECLHQQTTGSIDLYVRDNATYYVDFFGARLNNNDDDTTDNPSVTINGNTYNYTGTLYPKSNYTYTSFPFPSTNYDDITSVSVDGNKEVMLNIIYVNPTWRVTNAFVSKSGSTIDTSMDASDYSDTRVINYMDRSPSNPQFMLLKGNITRFTEPSWSNNVLECKVTGLGNSIYLVDVADQGNATWVKVNGTEIDFDYNSTNGIISFNVTLSSTKNIKISFWGTYEPLMGTLSVDTTPVKGGVFVDGESWGIAPQSRLLPEGNYTVSFGDIPGYVTPSLQNATVIVGETTSVLGTYEPAMGTLSVDTTPVSGEVFVDGESWGIAPQDRILPEGTYTVSFGDVSGYVTPPPQSANVVVGETVNVLGTYEPVGEGTLSVDTTPVKGEVFVDGISWGEAPQTNNVTAETHIVSFGDIAGYLKPDSQEVTLADGENKTVVGIYEEIPPVLMYPPDGDSWTESTDGWIIDYAGGSLTTSFDSIVGEKSLHYTYGGTGYNNRYFYKLFSVASIDNTYELKFWHKGDSIKWSLSDQYKNWQFYFHKGDVKSGWTGEHENWTLITVDLSDIPLVDPDTDVDKDGDDFYDIEGIVFGGWADGMDVYVDGLHFEKAQDTTPPQYFNSSTNSTLAGTPVEFRLRWTDNVGLSGYIFSFDNGLGTFTNDTWVQWPDFPKEDWSNVTKVVNSEVGKTIRWKVYAKDTSNNWNVSETYSFVTNG